MFAGRFNDAYRKAELDHAENFETPLIRETFKAMLDDWTNAGVRPVRQPGRDRQAVRRQGRQQHRGRHPPPRRRQRAWSACRATSRSAPTPPTRSTACSPTCRRTSPRSTPSRASRTRSPRSTCTPTSAAATSRGTRRRQRVQGQPVLPDHRGVHPAGVPRQRPCRVVRAAQRRDRAGTCRTATPAPRAKVTMKAGDVAAMPGDIRHQGYCPSARCCWCGRTPRPSCRS